MALFIPVKRNAPFEKADPRVRIIWMFALSATVITLQDALPIGILILSNIVVFLLARRFQSMMRATLHMIPFLLFLAAVQLVTQFFSGENPFTYRGAYRTMLEVMRFYVMVTSAIILFQTTDFGEMSAAIRSLKVSDRPTRWNAIVESAAFVIGLGYQTVPLLAREMQIITQVQRGRGVGIREGSGFAQARKMLRMGMPLFIRTLGLLKNMGLAITNYRYSPRGARTRYRRLHYRASDYIATLLIAGASITIIIVF